MIELELRDLKSTMSLDVLRRKTPEAVRQELWTGLLAYNLIRQSMLQSALAADCRPQPLSFAASLQMLANTWLLAGVPPLASVSARERLAALRILNGHSHRVGNRPNRVEPRAVKRRPNPLALLTEPRATAQARLVAGQKSSAIPADEFGSITKPDRDAPTSLRKPPLPLDRSVLPPGLATRLSERVRRQPSQSPHSLRQ